MPHTIEYIAHRVSNFNVLNTKTTTPIQIQSGGFMLCLNGNCDVVVDTKQYHIKEWDLVVVFPYSIIQTLHSSDDFDSIMIGVGVDFFAHIQLPNKGLYFTTIKDHPSIQLTQEEASNIIALNDMLIAQQQRTTHPFRGEIEEAILKIILYEVATIYINRKPNSEHKCSRDETIFHTFIFALFNDYKRERSLTHYAQLQLITASHLSKVVKRVSGRNASRWVVDCVINNLKFSLQNKLNSINDISTEYNFPNSSFFAQYFKKYTGISPKEYRKMIDARLESV
ncbi:MAG: helix-turn-helix domain-containing protein [Rikenellaceae bacterium]